MAYFDPKVNLGVNALWEVVYTDFKPYVDRLQSTNVREFTRDTTLDKISKPFIENVSINKQTFIQDKKLGS